MKELINKYVWIVDTITRYGALTREEINDLWQKNDISEGQPMPARTFYNYRRSIEENFHIDINCDSAGRYYIEQTSENSGNPLVTKWLLESYAVNSAMKEASIPAGRVEVEDVPSARRFLPVVLSAIGQTRKLRFTYAGFSKSRPEAGILFRPYLVKRYKQRWYMIGLKETPGMKKNTDQSRDIRTYALDRVTEMEADNERFECPADMPPADFFKNIIGITASKAEVRTVKIITTPTQAKYFRALPFHATQEESIHDNYSVFTFRLKLNYELVHELLGFGNAIKVVEPRELVVMLREQLENTLSLYDDPDSIPKPQ